MPGCPPKKARTVQELRERMREEMAAAEAAMRRAEIAVTKAVQAARMRRTSPPEKVIIDGQ